MVLRIIEKPLAQANKDVAAYTTESPLSGDRRHPTSAPDPNDLIANVKRALNVDKSTGILYIKKNISDAQFMQYYRDAHGISGDRKVMDGIKAERVKDVFKEALKERKAKQQQEAKGPMIYYIALMKILTTFGGTLTHDDATTEAEEEHGVGVGVGVGAGAGTDKGGVPHVHAAAPLRVFDVLRSHMRAPALRVIDALRNEPGGMAHSR
jgi:hypothetical protein